METLVGARKRGDATLEQAYEQALLGSDIRHLPITQIILREAARLRATTKVKTPDALRFAAAQTTGCTLFITNDVGFRGVAGVAVVILDDLLKP